MTPDSSPREIAQRVVRDEAVWEPFKGVLTMARALVEIGNVVDTVVLTESDVAAKVSEIATILDGETTSAAPESPPR